VDRDSEAKSNQTHPATPRRQASFFFFLFPCSVGYSYCPGNPAQPLNPTPHTGLPTHATHAHPRGKPPGGGLRWAAAAPRSGRGRTRRRSRRGRSPRTVPPTRSTSTRRRRRRLPPRLAPAPARCRRSRSSRSRSCAPPRPASRRGTSCRRAARRRPISCTGAASTPAAARSPSRSSPRWRGPIPSSSRYAPFPSHPPVEQGSPSGFDCRRPRPGSGFNPQPLALISFASSSALAGGGQGGREAAPLPPGQPHRLLLRRGRAPARRRVHAQRHARQAPLPLCVCSCRSSAHCSVSDKVAFWLPVRYISPAIFGKYIQPAKLFVLIGFDP
jgi:hypothetical protein